MEICLHGGKNEIEKIRNKFVYKFKEIKNMVANGIIHKNK
jgi:ribosomal protein S20